MAKYRLLKLPTTLAQPFQPITCSACPKAKQKRKPFRRVTRQYDKASVICSDLCGPIAPTSYQGNKYLLVFACTATRYLIVNFLPDKKAVKERVKQLLTFIKRLHGKYPKTFHTDNGGEFLNHEIQQFCKSHNIQHTTRLPYMPQENSIAERINDTIMSAARAALAHSGLPLQHWEDAARDATYKYNITVHSATNELPYTQWHNTEPPITRLFAFGQTGNIPVLKDKTKITKLHTRAHNARYLYAIDHKHIMTYNHTIQKRQIVRAIDFLPYRLNRDPVKHSTLTFKAIPIHAVPSVVTPTTPEPANPSQARKYPDAMEWAIAHNAEIEQLDKRGTVKWIPDKDLPTHVKPIPLTMKYRYKRSPSGNIEKRKARCNVRGDKMKPFTHYDPENTTSYNADLSTIRLLMAIAAAYNLHKAHLDIEGAYLHEKYNHTQPVYVKQPRLFDGTLKHKGCSAGLLVGNIYGGKNSGNTYLTAAFAFLRSKGYQQSTADPCLFHQTTPRAFIVFTVTTDDFYAISNHDHMITKLQSNLAEKYKVKDLGEPRRYIGWNVQRFKDGSIFIKQPDHVEKVLHKMRMSQANGKHTPYIDGLPLHPPTASDTPIPNQSTLYQFVLGDIRYITDSTRPDIQFITGRLASAIKNPTTRHWQALKSLTRYLARTKQYGIFYSATDSDVNRVRRDATRSNEAAKVSNAPAQPALQTYADANHAADTTDRKSISGIVHLFNKGPVSWASRKQSIRALSTCEAEYIAGTTAVQHTLWLRRILGDISFLTAVPTTMFMDNQAAIQIATNRSPTRKRKYIDLRRHYLQDHVEKRQIVIKHISITHMLADLLTKPLKRKAYTNLVAQLNIIEKEAASNHASRRPPRDWGSETNTVNNQSRSASVLKQHNRN